MIFATCGSAWAQEVAQEKPWQFNASAYLYFIPNDFLINPILTADKNKLHLESRYNYEDVRTFSEFVGRNFMVDGKISGKITPILGVVAGRSNGIAPGIEFDLQYRKWNFTSESEYLVEVNDKTSNFGYTWTELTYSPKDWYWFGISIQRTRLYQTDLQVQKGLLVGFSRSIFSTNFYLWNLGFADPFFMLSVAADF